MRLLLDTHIWLWNLLEPRRISSRVAKELANPANEIWLSPVSLWEAVILWQKNRITIDEDVEAWFEKSLKAFPIIEAPLTNAVALETRQLRISQKDPADRFLVATASIYDLTFVTGDRRLLNAPGISILPNR